MKTKLLLFLVIFFTSLFSHAQFGVNTKGRVPGTFRSYGYDALDGMYKIYFKDGSFKTTYGTIKYDGKQYLRVKGMSGKQNIYPQGTTKIVLEIREKPLLGKETVDSFVFETLDDKFWVYNVGEKLENVYFAPRVEAVAAKKQNGVLKQLTKEEVLALVAGNSKAEKFAKKEEYDKAFAEYNQISTSPYRDY